MTAAAQQSHKAKSRRDRAAPAPLALTELMDRQPPFDLEAEIGLLGSIILLPPLLDDVLAIVQANDFYDDAHRKLFSHLSTMHAAGKRIDITLLANCLKAAGDYEAIGGSAYVAKVAMAVPNAAHVVYYADIVRQKSELRQTILAYTIGLQQAYDELPVQDITSAVEAKLAALGQNSATPIRSIGEAAAAAIEEIDTAADAPSWPGTMTGLHKLDEAMGAMLPGEMIVIAARPGQGKTALGMQIAEYAANRDRPSLIVSLEMRDTELVKRKLCEYAGLDSRDVRSGNLTAAGRQRMRDSAQQFANLPLRLWSPASATLAEIRAVARRAKANGGLQLLVVDYLSLIRPGSDDRRLPRFEQVQNISAGLKSLSKELDLPVIALCQLNREADKDEPRLIHLRESGAIEQDADLVLFLFHPPKQPHIGGEGSFAQAVHVIVAKHRHGQVGKVSLLWHPRETRFSSPDGF